MGAAEVFSSSMMFQSWGEGEIWKVRGYLGRRVLMIMGTKGMGEIGIEGLKVCETGVGKRCLGQFRMI